MKYWWEQGSFVVWNRLVAINSILALIALILRLISEKAHPFARLIMIINAVIYFQRLFKAFFANNYLGPKVIMIWKLVMVVFDVNHCRTHYCRQKNWRCSVCFSSYFCYRIVLRARVWCIQDEIHIQEYFGSFSAMVFGKYLASRPQMLWMVSADPA